MNSKNLASKLLLFELFVMMVLLVSIFMESSYAQQTIVKVVPEQITVGSEGVPLPTEPFLVNVTVVDVTDLYAWQAKIYYDNSILQYVEAFYPTDFVFAGRDYVTGVPPTNGSDAGGVYFVYGCTLKPGESTFNGTGVLYQIRFKGIKAGQSPLRVGLTYVTYTKLYNSTYLGSGIGFAPIPFTTADGNVTVIPEFQTSYLMPLLMITSLVSAFLAKKALSKKVK
jgi:hypothetical protein